MTDWLARPLLVSALSHGHVCQLRGASGEKANRTDGKMHADENQQDKEVKEEADK